MMPKYRVWDKKNKAIRQEWGMNWSFNGDSLQSIVAVDPVINGEYILREGEFELMQWTGISIRGVDLYEDDIVEFTDKWEWYKGTYAIKMMFAESEEKKELKAKFDAEPMYRFVVEYDPFEGVALSSYDLAQDRYQIIGNKFQDGHLLKEE